MNKSLVIINPTSGINQSVNISNHIIKQLEEHYIKYDCLTTEYKNHAMEFIYKIDNNKYHNIIAIGGDGTYHEIINGIMKRNDNYSPILGFIPAGSGNSLMHDLKCLNPNDAIKKILNKNISKLDVMQLQFNDSVDYAFNILGWGLATDIGISAEKIRWIGPSRYTLASLYHIFKLNKREAEIMIDDTSYKKHFIFILICNTMYTGNAMMAAPQAEIDDGLLDVIILNKEITRFKLLQLLPKLFKGEHIKSSYVEYKQAKKIILKPQHNEILNIDGEIKNYSPVTIKVLKHQLSIYR